MHLLVALLSGLVVACAADERPPSFLLITLDTTRADRIGAYGYESAITPTIDALADHGVLFEQALAPAPITLTSHTSILTGLYPPGHGVHGNGAYALRPEAELVSEALRDRGWRTGAFVGSYVLDARFGLDQGFEVYRDVTPDHRLSEHSWERTADSVVDDAIAWLSGVSADEPFFAWVHLWDPHRPFAPPRVWLERTGDPYDAEIAFCDEQIARLMAALEERGRARDLITIVTADHGESLGEHDEQSHGAFLYQSTARVPLIVFGDRFSNARVAQPVSTVAVAPTILRLAGISQGALPSIHLAPLLEPDGTPAPPSDEAIYLESELPYLEYRWHALRGVVAGSWKLIRGRAVELYQIGEWSDERDDRAEFEPERVATLQRKLDGLIEQSRSLGWHERRGISQADRERLEALGYAIEHTTGDPFDPSLPDGRDLIVDYQKAQAALRIAKRSREARQLPANATEEQIRESRRQSDLELRTAKRMLEEVRAHNPGDPLIANNLALIELQMGNLSRAAELLEYAVAARLLSGDSHFNLGLVYERMERLDDASAQMREAVEIDPDRSEVYLWLADRAQAAGDYGRAAGWLERLLQRLSPGSEAHRSTAHMLEEARRGMRRDAQAPASGEFDKRP